MRPRVLAISSTGGHWIQMLRLQPAFEGCDVTYATTNPDYQSDVPGLPFRTIIDANRTQKFKLILSLLSVAWVIITEKPDTILTTGAAPGFFALRLGKLFGKKTIWLDSIANAEELSLSGRKAGKHATLWLTQWEHLAKPEGPHYFGNVLGDIPESGEQRTENGVQKSEARGQRTGDRAPMEEIRSQGTGDRAQSEEDEGEEQWSEVGSHPSNLGSQVSDLSKQKSFRIFVTVGSDVPFDRMVKVIDQWAGEQSEVEVFAQIGRSTITPQNIQFCQFLKPTDFSSKLNASDLIIAHAGMGSILSALKAQKPILVMPRIGYLGETRNEHQVATVNHLAPLGIIQIAKDENELPTQLDCFEMGPTQSNLKPFATGEFTRKLNQAIQNFCPRIVSVEEPSASEGQCI